MSDVDRNQIQNIIDKYGFEEILLQFNMTPWKVLEVLDDLGYVTLEDFEGDY